MPTAGRAVPIVLLSFSFSGLAGASRASRIPRACRGCAEAALLLSD